MESLTFYTPDTEDKLGSIFFDVGLSCGLPSSEGDVDQQRISLDHELVKNKETTFFARVRGQSMIDAGLNDNDLLVIDKSLAPEDNKIAVCCIDGEYTVKRLRIKTDGIWLYPENPLYDPIQVTPQNDFMIWGIVTNVIKRL